MPSSTPEARDTQSAVAEASRLAVEASRRSAEGARATVEVMRGLLDDSAEISRKFFDVWAKTGEASLQAGFELQNAAFTTSLSLFETAATTQRALIEQWQTAAHEAQQATLDAFHAQVRASTRLAPRA